MRIIDSQTGVQPSLARKQPSLRGHIKIARIDHWIKNVFVLPGIVVAISIDRSAVVMGCVYNIPPIRSKDLPYLDVLSESINNPLRMLAGWYITRAHAIPPSSLLISLPDDRLLFHGDQAVCGISRY